MSEFIISIFAIGVIICAHEWGHMIVARRYGVGIREFSIGFGPKLIGFSIRNTPYSLRLLPIGGFVSMAGTDDDDTQCPDDINFYKKSTFSRMAIIAAGPVANIIFALIIFVFIFSVLGVPSPTNTISAILPDSPAQNAGLKSGDQIIRIDSVSAKDHIEDAVAVINSNANTPLVFMIQRGREEFTRIITPVITPGQQVGLIGIQLLTVHTRMNPSTAVIAGFNQTVLYTIQTFHGLSLLITGRVSFHDMMGPLGIIQLASHEANRGLLALLNLLAIISVNLAVINLLPIPVLDGGHLLLLGIEQVRRRPLKKEYERAVTIAGAAVLITLMITITYFDSINVVKRHALFKEFHPKQSK